MAQRLQKVLAQAGIASRRKAELLIQQGRVTVDDQVAIIGQQVEPSNIIHVDGQLLRHTPNEQTTRLIIYHKPVGEICSRSDPQGRPTVFDALPTLEAGRWISVGRLDINTSGLLLFSNDGTFANQLMHPSSIIEREYAVRILGSVSTQMLAGLKQGIELEDGMAHFKTIVSDGGRGANHWFRVIVEAGRNRLVRRLWESQGVTVSRLIRVRYGPVVLPRHLALGAYQEIDAGGFFKS